VHPKDIFLRHLDIIRFFLGARSAQVIHPQLTDVFGVLNSQDDISPTDPLDFVNIENLNELFITGSGPPIVNSDVAIYQFDQQTLLIKLPGKYDSLSQAIPDSSKLPKELQTKVLIPRKNQKKSRPQANIFGYAFPLSKRSLVGSVLNTPLFQMIFQIQKLSSFSSY
jgi:hypothetical protein